MDVEAELCPGAQEELWQAHARELAKYATLLVGPNDAADVVSDTFVKIAERGLGDVSNRRAYLFRAVTRTALDRSRTERRRQGRDLRAAVASSTTVAESDLDLRRAIARLSAQQRAVVYFTCWEDLDSPAIAELLDIEPATVRRHLARARQRLRKLLP